MSQFVCLQLALKNCWRNAELQTLKCRVCRKFRLYRFNNIIQLLSGFEVVREDYHNTPLTILNAAKQLCSPLVVHLALSSGTNPHVKTNPPIILFVFPEAELFYQSYYLYLQRRNYFTNRNPFLKLILQPIKSFKFTQAELLHQSNILKLIL